jgi:hypothetical protein
MGHRIAFAVLFALPMMISVWASPASAQRSCENLTALTLKNATITSATPVPSGPLKLSSGSRQSTVDVPAFCRVAGVAKPTSDSEINFEVWLPAKWNGKFLGTGNGGYGGTFSAPYREMAEGLRRGYASAGTDMGHDSTIVTGAIWALNHPERIADWGYRASHVTAEIAKTTIQTFYGSGPRLSYFIGCSDGGHEGLIEAQRYPHDYVGIVAGAPANFWTHQSAAWIWQQQRFGRDNPESIIPASKLPMITQAAVEACDRLDGVKDGVISDPKRCRFDPAALLCKEADGPACLTGAQVKALKEIYAGPRNSHGEEIYPGSEPGSELAWVGDGGLLGRDFYRFMVFNDSNWDYRTLNYDRDTATGDSKMAATINSTNPDLSAFKAQGGKMIMYHGWFDERINPRNTINYYEKAIAATEPASVEGIASKSGKGQPPSEFVRLFMVPGMTHCSGGPGPNAFGASFQLPVPRDPKHDIFDALEQWVEHSTAPESIVATKYVDDDPARGIVMTRPLCPYPQVAKYTGHGSTNEASNFVCRLPGSLGDGEERQSAQQR